MIAAALLRPTISVSRVSNHASMESSRNFDLQAKSMMAARCVETLSRPPRSATNSSFQRFKALATAERPSMAR
jgi:hypothetical protein